MSELFNNVDIDSMLEKSDDYHLKYDNNMHHIQYHKGHSKNLIIVFHGAMHQSVRPYPYFQKLPPEFKCHHQLRVADPTVSLSDTLGVGWYLGHENNKIQHIFPSLFADICNKLDIERCIYFGGSAGGYAALFYSWHHSESIAVVQNPQTNLMRYRKAALDLVKQHCWKGLGNDEDLAESIQIELESLYKQKFDNSIIYIQSRHDLVHFRRQMIPFFACLQANFGDLVSDIGYWGIQGHSGSVPPKVHAAWLSAALKSPSRRASDLILAHHKEVIERSALDPSFGLAELAKTDRQADIKLADRLAEASLSSD